jgi:hypothetical protein
MPRKPKATTAVPASGGTPPDVDSHRAPQVPTPATAHVREVTFRTGPAEWAGAAFLVGEFNHWATDATPMLKVGDHFEVTIPLMGERHYRFKYLLDGHSWENDPNADDYVENEFGGHDSVIRV